MILFRFSVWVETFPGCFEFVRFCESLTAAHKQHEIILPNCVNPNTYNS
jgi:hypothetical protein